MATIAHTKSLIANDDALVVAWANLANGDDGAPIALANFADRSVQFVGTWGAGGTAVLEGTIDGTNYVTLTDPQGNTISKTANALEMVAEVTWKVRPRVTAGDGTTDLTVSLLLKR